MKKVKIFSNNNEYSQIVLESLKEKLTQCGYAINDFEYDYAIAIGGDGAFLRMVKESNFSDKLYYLGINTGTLGFAQELYPKDIDIFFKNLEMGTYGVEKLSVQETMVHTNKSKSLFYSLNEIVIRDANLNTVHLDININNNLLETFVGDGILISTSFGSTAYNLSFKGSIVYSELHTLQITPIAPLNNKKYHTLDNSIIIPERRNITVIPKERTNKIIISIDGENKIYDEVTKIDTSIKKKKIKCLRMNEYDYTKKIYEKFVKM